MPERTVGILRDERGGEHGAEAAGELLKGCTDRAEGAALCGLWNRGNQRLRRNHARKDPDEHQDVDQDRDRQTYLTEMRVDQHHDNGHGAAEREGGKFAKSIARPSHQRSDENTEQAGDQIDRRQMNDIDAEIMHGIGAAEGHQHVAAGRQQRRHRECHPIAWLYDRCDQMPEGVFVLP